MALLGTVVQLIAPSSPVRAPPLQTSTAEAGLDFSSREAQHLPQCPETTSSQKVLGEGVSNEARLSVVVPTASSSLIQNAIFFSSHA